MTWFWPRAKKRDFASSSSSLMKPPQVGVAQAGGEQALPHFASSLENVFAAPDQGIVVDTEHAQEKLFIHAVQVLFQITPSRGTPWGVKSVLLRPLRLRKLSSQPAALRSFPPILNCWYS